MHKLTKVSAFLVAVLTLPPPELCFAQKPGVEQAAEVESADRELNAVYQQVMSTLGQAQQTKLRDEERAWIKQRDINADQIARDGGAVGHGSAYREDFLTAKAQLIHKRTEELGGMLGGDAARTPGNRSVNASANSANGALETRFNVRGISTGMTVQELEASTLFKEATARESKNGLIGIGEGKQTISYVEARSFGLGQNGNSGSIVFEFTPPFGSNPSRICKIVYQAPFGEGVDETSIIKDVEKKYGAGTELNGLFGHGPPSNHVNAARWDPVNDFAVVVSADAAPRPGTSGTLAIVVANDRLKFASWDKAKEWLAGIDAQRPKDQTRPTF